LNLRLLNHDHKLPEMNLVLALMSSGCTFEQIRGIIGCKHNSMQALLSQYFGKSNSCYMNLRKFLSDEHCLKMWMMITQLKGEFGLKFIKKLVYPSFVCIFTFSSLIFFKVTLLPKIRSMFALESNEMIFNIFDIIVFVQGFIFICLVIALMFLKTGLSSPDIRNFIYLKLYSKIKNNLLTVYTTGLFSRMMLECIKSGISTQNSLELLGKLNEYPFVAILARSCSNKLSKGHTFTDSISDIETDSSFKYFIQLGLYENNVICQLSNYCDFNSRWLESKLQKLVDGLYFCVYIQFSVSVILIYQIIQIPISKINSLM
jgi:type II secretory pathway component PulF